MLGECCFVSALVAEVHVRANSTVGSVDGGISFILFRHVTPTQDEFSYLHYHGKAHLGPLD
jgi:hypothetical protein